MTVRPPSLNELQKESHSQQLDAYSSACEDSMEKFKIQLHSLNQLFWTRHGPAFEPWLSLSMQMKSLQFFIREDLWLGTANTPL
jgi:hypothetical protein